MRRTDGLLFSDQSMAQITMLSGEEETRAQSLLFAKIASDFVLSNPDVPFNEEDIRQASDRLRRFAPLIVKLFPETKWKGGRRGKGGVGP